MFGGTVTDKTIMGQFEHRKTVFGEREFRLKRVSLDQKGYPDCR